MGGGVGPPPAQKIFSAQVEALKHPKNHISRIFFSLNNRPNIHFMDLNFWVLVGQHRMP